MSLDWLAAWSGPISAIIFAACLVAFICCIRAEHRRPRLDLEKLGISPDDIRLATGDNRGPLAELVYPTPDRPVAQSYVPPEDRVIILALSIFEKLQGDPHPRQALLALRVAELLMLGRCTGH